MAISVPVVRMVWGIRSSFLQCTMYKFISN